MSNGYFGGLIYGNLLANMTVRYILVTSVEFIWSLRRNLLGPVQYVFRVYDIGVRDIIMGEEMLLLLFGFDIVRNILTKNPRNEEVFNVPGNDILYFIYIL